MSKLKNAVIARGRMILRYVAHPHAQKQSPSPEHYINKPQRFVHFTSYFRGLLQAIEVYLKNQHPVGFRNDGLAGFRNDGMAGFRNDGLAVRLLFVSYFIFHLSYLAPAQTAYTGGPGDGHAMGELELRTVGSAELSSTQGYQVYPTIIKAGEAVYITSPTAGEFTMVDVSGRVIYAQAFSGPVQPIHVTVTQSGLYLGIIRTSEGTFTQKIIVLE